MSTLLLILALTATAPAQVPPCSGADLSVTFDFENGQFDGMSHAGALLVLRNYSEKACAVPGRPNLQFTGKSGKALEFKLQVPPGMHPGPVIVPVVIPAGAEATAPMGWINGYPFSAKHCIETETVHLSLLNGLTVSAPLHILTCSAAGQPATYQMPFLRRDPAYKP